MLETFKYQKEIDFLLSQGKEMPLLHTPLNKRSYRYVFSSGHSNETKNHKPVYINQPARMIKNIDKACLTGYSLSCYENKEKAIEVFRQHSSTHKNFHQTAGNCLSEGILNDSDGLITEKNNTTHFDLFEFKECDLSSKFNITEVLI